MIKKINKTFFITLIGVAITFNFLATTKSDTYRQIAQSQRLINDVYKNIVTYYVDELNIEEFTRVTLEGMVSAMDPYTVYLEADEHEGLDLLTTGKYSGVGMQISRRDNQITVIAPIEDSPAERSGILSGDIIVKIDDTETDNLNLNETSKMIRGKKGTQVVLYIKRFDLAEPLEFTLTRADIRIKDVPYAEFITDDIGYIRLTRFTSNSVKETKQALNKLNTDGLKALIIDLRDNPGGLLNSAINILDMLVADKQLLLTTHGRIKGSTKELYSRNEPIIDPEVKIAILINNGSASASEIIAGVIQDLDRGIVVGSQSFGKGLVQSVVNLDKDKILKITTAKYYTPSGRLIQKDGYIDNSLIHENIKVDSLFSTINGRVVSSGGGIFPDFESSPLPNLPLTTECYRQGIFFSFIQKQKHNYSDFSQIAKDENLLFDFKEYLKEINLEIPIPGEKNFNQAIMEFAKLDSSSTDLQLAIDNINKFIDANELEFFKLERQYIENILLEEFAFQFDGDTGRFRERLKTDEAVIKTIKIINDDISYEQVLVAEK